MIIPQTTFPFNPNVCLDMRASIITQALQTSAITATGTSGTATITGSATVTLLFFIGQTIVLSGTDTYTITNLSGVTITVTPNLTTSYVAAAITYPAVSNWADLSGKANDALQSTVAQQPVHVAASAIGSLPALGFSDTTTRVLATASSASITNLFATGGTLLTVFRPRTSVSAGNGRIATNGSWNLAYNSLSAMRWLNLMSGAAWQWEFTTSGLNNNYVVLIQYNQASLSTTPVLYFNSTTSSAMTLTSTGTGTMVANTGIITVGNIANGGRPFDGFISAVYAWPYLLNTQQIKALMKMMGARYGVTIS